jgi:serine/threonine-protein kinase
MALKPGTQLGSYEITSLLGSGGMGQVYRAKDFKLERDVAIKVLREELAADPERLRRFEQEARSASALNHPNIITIYDIGKHEITPYIAMEYVEGKTLRKILAEGPLPTKKLLQLGTQIAEGLAKAHSAGIVHRDLKPENLMVSSDGYVKILDFGLAKLRPQPSETDSEAPTVTRESAVMGTVGYMSPEQAKGQPADFHSDQFSFGAILYEMVTGRRAFQRDSSVQTLSAIIDQEPASITALHPETPAHLRVIVERCLAKNPEERYDSSRDLARELKSIGETAKQPPSALTAVPVEKRRLWPRIFTIGGGLAAVLTLLLLLNADVLREWILDTSPSKRIESIAVLPLDNLSGDPEQEYFVDGMTDELIAELAQISALKVISRTSVMQYKEAQKPLPEIARELNVDAVVEGTVRRSEDRVRVTAQLIEAETDRNLWADSFDRELSDVLVLQSEVARAIAQEIKVTVTPEEQTRLMSKRSVNPASHEAYLKGRYFWNKRTNEDLRKAIEFFQEAREMDPEYALAHVGLADCYVVLGSQFYGADEDFPPKEAFGNARSAALAALQLDPTLVEAQTTLAFIRFYNDWDWRGAERDFRQAIALNPNYITAHQWYSWYLSSMGRHEEAIEGAKRAIELDPISPLQNRELGVFFYYARRYREAIEQLEKTLELDASFPEVREYLIDSYWFNGLKEKAIEVANKLDERLGKLYQLAKEGRQTEATQLRLSLQEQSLIDLLRWYMLAGDHKELFQRLEDAYEERHPLLPFILADPHLDPLRSNPRFQDLLRRMNLPIES